MKVKSLSPSLARLDVDGGRILGEDDVNEKLLLRRFAAFMLGGDEFGVAEDDEDDDGTCIIGGKGPRVSSLSDDRRSGASTFAPLLRMPIPMLRVTDAWR
jgi:hypothetical protein